MSKLEKHHKLVAKRIYRHGNEDKRWEDGKTKVFKNYIIITGN
jgi:hypothetical protein